MPKWIAILILIFGVCGSRPTHGQAVPLSSAAEVSLITCGPGNDLYATFGHSALAISDPVNGIDRVYNYGTFDFNTPNFYLKFARGKLNYMLSVSTMRRFLRVYQYEGRWVKLQKLNLTAAEKMELYRFLENNAKPKNRDYKYDFFYDNCSTRLRDALENVLGEKLEYQKPDTVDERTFRDLIDLYLTNHPWSDLGIDLALGAPCDNVANRRQQMFLPDFLMSHIGQATVVRAGMAQPLVEKTVPILMENTQQSDEKESGTDWIFWTLFAIAALSAIFLRAGYFRWFDISFFFITGLLGIFIALLWFATDHSATKWNFNLLWALPTWIWGAVLLIRKKSGSRFFKVHAILMFAILIFWIAIPQNYHDAVIPLVLALGARSWAWQKIKHNQIKA